MSNFFSKKAATQSGRNFTSRFEGVSMPNGVLLLGEGNTVLANSSLTLSTLTVPENATLEVTEETRLTVTTMSVNNLKLSDDSSLAFNGSSLTVENLDLASGSVVVANGELIVTGKLTIRSTAKVAAGYIRCKNIHLEPGGRIEGYVTQEMVAPENAIEDSND